MVGAGKWCKYLDNEWGYEKQMREECQSGGLCMQLLQMSATDLNK